MQLFPLEITGHLHLIAHAQPRLVSGGEQSRPLSAARVLEQLQAFAFFFGRSPDLPQPLASVDDVLTADHPRTDPRQCRDNTEIAGENAVLRIGGDAGRCSGFHLCAAGRQRCTSRTVHSTGRPGWR
ncbi:hypothetical protein D3C72_2096740 [compost metagenome]